MLINISNSFLLLYFHLVIVWSSKLHFPSRKKILSTFSFLAFFLFVYHIFASWYSVYENGDATLLMISPLIYFLPVTGAALYLPFLIFLAFFHRTREDSVTGILVCLILLTFFGMQIFIGERIRIYKFHKLVNESQELIQAIEDFHSEKGRYPVMLQQLVPKYLKEYPKTNMQAYPDFQYITGSEVERSYPENSYAILISVPQSFFNFDKLLYLPKQNYKETLTDVSYTKIGNWVYVND